MHMCNYAEGEMGICRRLCGDARLILFGYPELLFDAMGVSLNCELGATLVSPERGVWWWVVVVVGGGGWWWVVVCGGVWWCVVVGCGGWWWWVVVVGALNLLCVSAFGNLALGLARQGESP